MKTTKLILALAGIFILRNAFCDVIPDNAHPVSKCVKITNLSDYPDISLIGCVKAVMDNDYSYLICDTVCLHKGYKFNKLTVYALSNSYLEGKDTAKLDLSDNINAFPANIQIEPYGGYYPDSDPTISIEQCYKILGFSNDSVVLFKWKEITSYNDGTPEKTEIFEFKGNATAYSQQIPANLNPVNFGSKTKLYPNPNRNKLIISADNNFSGRFSIGIYTLNGQFVKSFQFNKTSIKNNFEIATNDLPEGTYVIRMQFGAFVESSKILIN